MVTRTACAVAVWVLAGAAGSAASETAARLRGEDFTGGAAKLFGSAHHGAAAVNYVYAQPTGEHARMEAKFRVARLPAGASFLHIKACDDDSPGMSAIEILLNDQRVFRGPSGFPDAPRWGWRAFRLPENALKAGENRLAVANVSEKGELGQPPWFMVAAVAVAGETYDPSDRLPIEQDFQVMVPREERPFPEPLPPGREKPGFAIRGTKGWMWTPEQYLAEIPVLAKYKMNFLMNCYTSMCDVENVPWGDPKCNRWWEPLPAAKRAAYEKIARACRDAGVHFCFSMNPNLSSERFVNTGKAEDIDALWQHYDWMQRAGVQWFNISLDDIHAGIDAAAQAKVVNEICRRLRSRDAQARMIFCPTYYWGTGEDAKARPYLETLAVELDPDVYVFWTGDEVVGPVTRAAAEKYKARVRHRIILWDNYPVNDKNPTLHLGPVMHRDRDLCDVVEGEMSNALCPQNEINRLPLLTIADYAWNPWAYDPARSIGQAIRQLARTPEQQAALRDLVELYPGMLLLNKGTNWNPVIERFGEIASKPHSRVTAEAYRRHVRDVLQRFRDAFREQFQDAQTTLAADVQRIDAAFAERYGEKGR